MHFDKLCAIQSTLPQKYAARNKSGVTLLVLLHFLRPSWSGTTHQERMVSSFLFIFFSSLFFFTCFPRFYLHRYLPSPPHALTTTTTTTSSRPQGILRSDWVIRRLLLCSSDVIYLVPWSHPVIMTRHSYLLCALYLYMTRLLLLFFCSTVLLLDLSSILFFFLCHICN